jgi:hypothetical protein
MIGNYDPRYLAMYGKQPPMGMAGSVPPAQVSAPPSFQSMPMQQPQPQMGMAGAQGAQGIGMAQQPVVPPAPMPQPQGVGVAFNADQGAPISTADFAMQEAAGGMGMSGQAPSKSGFDLKGLAKDLFGGKKNTSALSMATDLTPDQNAGIIRPKSAPDPIGMQANQGQGQPSTSAAMSAITGGIGSSPQLDQMLKALRYAR